MNHMKTELKLELQAFLDQELSPSQARKIAALLEHDTEAKALAAELKATKAAFAGNELEIRVPASHDFYWSRIQQRILADEREVSRVKAPSPNWFARFLAPLAGVAAVALFLLSNGGGSNQSIPTVASVHEMETPGDDGGAFTFRSEAHGMTLVWITSGN